MGGAVSDMTHALSNAVTGLSDSLGIKENLDDFADSAGDTVRHTAGGFLHPLLPAISSLEQTPKVLGGMGTGAYDQSTADSKKKKKNKKKSAAIAGTASLRIDTASSIGNVGGGASVGSAGSSSVGTLNRNK